MNISVTIFVAIVIWGIMTVAHVVLPAPFTPLLLAVIGGAVAGMIVR